MKKFINRPEEVVEEMLQGLAVLQPATVRLPGQKVLVIADHDAVREQRVAILSGGGSGHEPAHAGYVGAGMLSAAVLGEVFTSPSSDAVFAAIQSVAGAPGALLVVKNYTGDRLNFGLAAEMARAEGIAVEMLIVDDDVAMRNSQQATGARGLAGTVFIHKVVGAAAAEGKSLAEVLAIGKAAVSSLATMGVSFSAGISPAVGKPSFVLGEREMELGLGIHGEPGVKRAELEPADKLVETLLSAVLEHDSFGEARRVAVLINNLGATTPMELAILARHAVPYLESKGYTVERIYAGTMLSSLDMAGVSISVLGVDDDRLRWLDADTAAPAWPHAPRQRPGIPDPEAANKSLASDHPPKIQAQTDAGRRTRAAIDAACAALLSAADELTELDRITGDGDLGSSMERAAKAVRLALETYPVDDISATLKELAHTLRRELGGSSGPLYGMLFLLASNALASASDHGRAAWTDALEQGSRAMSELGGAAPGDRTMLDALDPLVRSIKDASGQDAKQIVIAAVQAAEEGTQATAQMKPRLGRSSYLGDQVLGHVDPGAKALVLWISAAAEAYFRE